MLNTLRHLLPDSIAWRLVVERNLKKYLRGVATVGTDVVSFIDDIYDDLFPQTTRELTEWLKTFGIDYWPWSNDQDMRDYLDFRWGEDRGQSPKALQDKLHAAGFSAYVYDSFDRNDVSLSVYTGDTFSLPVAEANPHGFCFAKSGYKLYFAGDIGNAIYAFDLTQPYDVSTAVAAEEQSWGVGLQDGSPFDVKVSPDGTKMFMLGAANDAIYEYTLPTPFVLTDAAYVDSLSVTTQETVPQSFHWNPDGTEVYVTGTGSDDVHQYSLSTAWDVSSGSFTRTYDPGAISPTSITFNYDGTVMLLLNATTDDIEQYDLSTAWDISTASSASKSLDTTTEDTDPFQVVVEGDRLFMLGIGSNDIYGYRFGAWRDPLTYADQPKTGNTQCGDDGSGINPVAECGEEPPDQRSLDSAVCNNLLASEVWYLVNEFFTGAAPPKIPTDPTKWGPFWYVGGTPIGTLLEVDEYDRPRFEKLCLKHGPADKWIVTILDIWRTTLLGNWLYQGPATGSPPVGRWTFTEITITPARIRKTDTDGNDVTTELLAIASGDKLRFVRDDDGSWIEYAATGAAVNEVAYVTVAVNTSPVAQSSDWTNFPSSGARMQIYHRESV